MLRSSGTPGATGQAQPTALARGGHDALVRPLGNQVVYQRVEPSVVDVTSTLRYAAETASGTGFIIDGRAGLVLTNNHVIRDATTVTARVTATGRTYRARIVGVDVGADIAVLQLQGAAGLTAAPIGDSATVTPGAPVLAIGNQAGHGGYGSARPGQRQPRPDDPGGRRDVRLHRDPARHAPDHRPDPARRLGGPAGRLGGHGDRHGHRGRNGNPGGRLRDPDQRRNGRRTADRRRASRPRGSRSASAASSGWWSRPPPRPAPGCKHSKNRAPERGVAAPPAHRSAWAPRPRPGCPRR